MSRSAAAFHSPLRRGALRLCGLFLALIVFALPAATPACAITIQFDYSYDTLGFFGTEINPTPARTTLEFAARTFTPFMDTLSAIQPGGGNSWTAKFNPLAPWSEFSIPQLQVPQDTLIVYAIAGDLIDSRLGQASPGYASYSGDPLFGQAVSNRGQGDSDFDFAPWGGFIAVDIQNSSGVPRNWHFDLGTSPSAGSYDFYTVVTHELAHLFGFGISNAFSKDKDASGSFFIGANAQALYGGTVPLTGGQHWASNVTSPPFLPGTQPKPSLGPSLTLGERKLFTPLDYAALADIGWQVPPELLGLPADFNGDAIVDGADFLIWQRGYGGFGGTPGDANGDLFVDDVDGWIVRNYLGSQGSVPESIAANAVVPEPAAVALAVVGLGTLVVRSCRRRHALPKKSVGGVSDPEAAR